MADIDIYLASASPRRRELLTQLGVRFAVRVSDHPEQLDNDESAEQFVQRLASAKAESVWQSLAQDQRRPVLGADTVVVIDEHILGKPESCEDAQRMLGLLSGREHRVLTAVSLVGRQRSVYVNVSSVRFRILDPAEIRAYWDTGEPRDKAGAYAIQGFAAAFIEHLEGSYSGVMGLPLYETSQLLRRENIPIWQDVTQTYE